MDYKITAVTVFYNEEKYISQAIDSLLGQTIGFQENIQLVLVNDGSTDNSRAICEEYVSRYPENITLIDKENSGVSDSRNLGKKYIKGKYAVFFDGDDIWEADAFRTFYDAFESFGDNVDVCSCRIQYIGDFAGRTYPLDYKYSKGVRIADLMKEPDAIQITIGNVVFRSEVLAGRVFDTDMTYCEDSWFVNQVMAEKAAMGVIPDAVFYYRKNQGQGNQSVRIVETKAWFFDVIRNYYLKMLHFAEEKFGAVPEYFQRSIFYDIKWRKYNPSAVHRLTETEKEQHLELLRETLSYIDDRVIFSDKAINQYQKLYYLNLKNNGNVLEKASFRDGKFYLEKRQIFSLHAASIFRIKTIIPAKDSIIIEGISRIDSIGMPYDLYAADEKGRNLQIELYRHERADYTGLTGETFYEGKRFRVVLPAEHGRSYGFFIETRGNKDMLQPNMEGYLGLKRSWKTSYCRCGSYLISHEGGWLKIYSNNGTSRMWLETKMRTEAAMRTLLKKDHSMSDALRKERDLQRAPLQDRAAFLSTSGDGYLTGNLQKVWDGLDCPKVQLSDKRINKDPELLEKAVSLAGTSRIVIFDDYIDLRGYSKKLGQKYIQLWHASGAGKKFGQDGTTKLLAEDALYHKDYDLVAVSSEAARSAFSSAFGIGIEKTAAIGIARTDDYYDPEYIERKASEVLGKHPELKDRRVIMYAPTFRDDPGSNRKYFRPDIDFGELSEALGADKMFVICPHPIMTEPVLRGKYNNVVEIRDVSANDMMFVSDLLITDYSSVMFEYSLLGKPMAFYCYDYDTYDREFYMDFQMELPGPLMRTHEELIEYISRGEFAVNGSYQDFRKKYLGACDGHSTERIVKIIEEMMHE